MNSKKNIIATIVDKFGNNALLTNELDNVLAKFDLQYLVKLNEVLGRHNLENLNGADNKLNDEINNLLNDKSLSEELKKQLTGLKNVMIKLQLNILLSYCTNKDQEIILPLITKINDKLASINNIIDLNAPNGKDELSQENINIIPHFESNNIIPYNNTHENIIFNAPIDQTIANYEIKDEIKKNNKINKKYIYPRLTNDSHNIYYKFSDNIFKKLVELSAKPTEDKIIDFFNNKKLIEMYKSLIFNAPPPNSLDNYYNNIKKSTYKPTGNIDNNQAIILYKIYNLLKDDYNKKNKNKEKFKNFVDLFIQYWKAELVVEKNTILNLSNKVLQSSTTLPIREKFDEKYLDNMSKEIQVNFDKNDKHIIRLIGGSKLENYKDDKHWYYKYLKYKTKYLMLG